MRHTVVFDLSGCTVFFHIVSYTARFSGKKVIEHIINVLIFSTTLSETFPILRRIERDMIINMYWSLCKVLVVVRY